MDLIFFGFRISFSTYAMRRFKRLHDLPLTFASQFAGVKETARRPMNIFWRFALRARARARKIFEAARARNARARALRARAFARVILGLIFVDIFGVKFKMFEIFCFPARNVLYTLEKVEIML